MVELNDLRNLLEALLELRDLLEVVAELDDGRRLEHALRVDDELAMLERVDVALDEQQITACLDWEETTAGNVDSMRIVKVLHRRTSCCFKLKKTSA